MKSAVHRQTLLLILLGALLAGLLAAGCGGDSEEPSPAPDYAKKLAGAPPPLAALYDQGNEILPGGRDAYEERIGELKGFPVVVNVWASWCGPCRAEFPYFQRLSAKLGKKVAFLGVNSEDSDELAKDFLTDYPVPYPSYADPDSGIANELGGRGFPRTVFYDSSGKLTETHMGQFPDQESLEEAIESYAVEGQEG